MGIAFMVVATGLITSGCSQAGGSAPLGTKSNPSTSVGATPRTLPARPSTGCSSPAHAELTLEKKTMTIDGVTRWYLISTPPERSGDRPFPVVLDLHGLGEGATLEALTTQFGPLGQKDGFITVFPQATGNPASWDVTDGPRTNHDLKFVSELLDQVEATECVDEARIYSAGFSLGAIMTSFLACAMSNRIAAFAPVSGVTLPSPCAAKGRVPILAFHGTADPILYFNGGVGSALLKHLFGGKGPAPSLSVPPAKLDGPGYPATVVAWAKRDGCGATPVETRVSSDVIHRVYKCPPGTAVEFYIVIGAGHAWPGSKFSQQIAAVTGPTTFQINATTIIWAFFERFAL